MVNVTTACVAGTAYQTKARADNHWPVETLLAMAKAADPASHFRADNDQSRTHLPL